jgi:hypothetical protein
MTVEHLHRVFMRDAASLRDELLAYRDDRQVWALPPGTKNSAGTLILHLTGNLQHFIGAQLGRTGYLRNRDAEFSRRDVPRTDLLAEIEAALAAVRRGFAALEDDDLAKPFPIPLDGTVMATGLVLLHMAAHLAYHLGQIDYHRRIVTGEAGSVNALSLALIAK